MNLNNMLKNPVYGKNKLKMHLKIKFPDASSHILPTFLKAYREQIVSLDFRLNDGYKLYGVHYHFGIILDPYLISYPNLEELSLRIFNKSYHGLISWMLMKHIQSLQKLFIYTVIFI